MRGTPRFLSDRQEGCMTLAPFIAIAIAAQVQTQTAPDAAALIQLLHEFLAQASSPAMHERFWADDLIYTRSAGRRLGKAEVLRDVSSIPAPPPSSRCERRKRTCRRRPRWLRS